MTVRDPYASVLAKPSINPATMNATTTGSSVDRDSGSKMFQAALVVIVTGTMTDGSHVISLEESADNSSWSAVAASDIQGTAPTLAAADDNVVKQIGYLGSKRYIRVKSTVTPGATGGIYGASVVLSDPRIAPSA